MDAHPLKQLAVNKGTWVRLARYGIVGLAGAVSFFATVLFFVEVLRLNVMFSTSMAFALVVAQNYILHRKWTFESNAQHRHALPQFFSMSTAGFAINWYVMHWGVERWDYDYRTIQALAVGLVVVWNFGISRFLIFASRPSTSSSETIVPTPER